MTMARRLAILYLRLQAAIVLAWWLVLWSWPAARAPFVVGDWPEATLLSFWPPDVALLVLGSCAAAHGLRRAAAWAPALVWALAGAVGYATLWCAGSILATGSGWLPGLLMVPAAAGTLLCALAVQAPSEAQ